MTLLCPGDIKVWGEDMNRIIMFIVFAVISLTLGFGVQRLVLLISRKVDNKEKACTYSCMLGIVLIMVLLLIAYLAMPAISRAMGDAVSFGVLV